MLELHERATENKEVGTMEDNVKKLTPNDLQGLAGGWQDEDLTPEERDEWYTLVQTYQDARRSEAGGPAWEAMMKFKQNMTGDSYHGIPCREIPS